MASALREFGFEDLGGQRYRRDDVVLDVRGPWWTLRCPAPSTNNGDWLSRPGLWKPADADGRVQVADLPARALGLRHDDQHDDLAAFVCWAKATRGTGVEAAQAEVVPAPELAAQELTARAGTLTCQGEVISARGRLYIDFPLPAPPRDLSAGAQHWLRAMLSAARGLRMARVAINPGTQSIHARVDLTGSPPVWRDALATQAAACLRSVVERLLPPITFLTTSASVGCRAVELGVEPGSLVATIKEKQGEQR